MMRPPTGSTILSSESASVDFPVNNIFKVICQSYAKNNTHLNLSYRPAVEESYARSIN